MASLSWIYLLWTITERSSLTVPISPVPAVGLQGVWCLPAEGKRRKSAGFGQTERKQQAVCQIECDGDIQNTNWAELTLEAWNYHIFSDQEIMQTPGCLWDLCFARLNAWTWHLALPHKRHAGGFYYWLMARSSSYIITNKDDSQDMINYP